MCLLYQAPKNSWSLDGIVIDDQDALAKLRSPIRLVSPEAIGGPTPRENIVGISIPAFFFLFGAGGFLVTRKWIDRFIDDGAAWVVLAFQKAPVQCLLTLLGALVGYFCGFSTVGSRSKFSRQFFVSPMP